MTPGHISHEGPSSSAVGFSAPSLHLPGGPSSMGGHWSSPNARPLSREASFKFITTSSCSFPALRCRHLGRHCVSSLSLLDLVTALSCIFSVSSAAFSPASRTRAVPTTQPLWCGPASLVVPQEGRGHFLLSVPLVDACEFLNDITMVFTSLGCLLAPSPDNELKLILKFYYHLGMNDNNIATAVMDHFDPSIYSISAYTVRRQRKVWGLSSTQEQCHSVETIAAHVDAIKEHFPNRGAETTRKALLMEKNICVPRPVVAEYLKMIEPDAVQARRYQRFKR
ncbi:hypothetical protein EDB86DRAFT_3165101 [Lactarius hatsudake]|nr:hypothetical protein EDB86DRAFT_3165101 [Lactarius hatsudake]